MRVFGIIRGCRDAAYIQDVITAFSDCYDSMVESLFSGVPGIRGVARLESLNGHLILEQKEISGELGRDGGYGRGIEAEAVGFGPQVGSPGVGGAAAVAGTGRISVVSRVFAFFVGSRSNGEGRGGSVLELQNDL